MTEQQDVQSLILSKVKSRIDTLLFEKMKEVAEVLQSWFQRLLSFEVKAHMALTEEERRSVEEEKQLFFNEIGVDEDSLKDMFTHCISFVLKTASASTDEELQSVEEEIDFFFKGCREYYKTALDKYVREKMQKSTAPAS